MGKVSNQKDIFIQCLLGYEFSLIKLSKPYQKKKNH